MSRGLAIFLVLVIILGGIAGGVYYVTKVSNERLSYSGDTEEIVSPAETVVEEKPEEIVEEKTVKIFSGDDRPISFMVDNNVNAQPQASLNKAYVVYECIVEGKETRLMPLFKGQDCDVVGPIRSARHYFVYLAMEHDAIYSHLGLSPQADDAFTEFDVEHINGQYYDTGKARTDTSLFWRASHKKAPHNAYTNIPSILKIAKGFGWKTKSDKESVLNYVTEEVNLDSEDSMVANDITIPYSSTHKVEYTYDENTGRYTRFSKGALIKDETTGEAVTTKNIIITFAKNYTLNDGENKGRQDVLLVGENKGYYITNGRAIKITCTKESETAQTVYADLEGNEIEVNDGNTWINVCPIDADVTIEE